MQRFPFLVAGVEATEGGLLAVRGGAGEHQGYLRHALAMAAGIGALGVDRAGHQLDEGIEQLLLFLQQALAFDTECGDPGDGLDEGDALRLEQVRARIAAGVAVQQH
ncbi:hypothetical protein D3C78_1598710 [compost metagenome]